MLAALRVVLRLPLFEPQEMLLRVRAYLYRRASADDLSRGRARAGTRHKGARTATRRPHEGEGTRGNKSLRERESLRT